MNSRCKCKVKEHMTKLWIINPFYDNTLEKEIFFRKNKRRLFSSNEIIDILKQILLGLEFLYKNNLYHRNLKPSNIGVIKKTQ